MLKIHVLVFCYINAISAFCLFYLSESLTLFSTHSETGLPSNMKVVYRNSGGSKLVDYDELVLHTVDVCAVECPAAGKTFDAAQKSKKTKKTRKSDGGDGGDGMQADASAIRNPKNQDKVVVLGVNICKINYIINFFVFRLVGSRSRDHGGLAPDGGLSRGGAGFGHLLAERVSLFSHLYLRKHFC